MDSYFKPTYMRWFYSPKTFWSNIIATFQWVKHLWQRAFRGYADCDWWDMSSYLTTIITPMLKDLRKYQHGYPGHGAASTPEGWNALLDEMIEGFEAGERVRDDEYYMTANSDILERRPTSDEVKQWMKMSKKDQKIFHDKMKLFNKWFFALWD